MIVHSAIQSSTRILITTMFDLQTPEQCLYKKVHSVVKTPYLVMIACDVLVWFVSTCLLHKVWHFIMRINKYWTIKELWVKKTQQNVQKIIKLDETWENSSYESPCPNPCLRPTQTLVQTLAQTLVWTLAHNQYPSPCLNHVQNFTQTLPECSHETVPEQFLRSTQSW